MTQIFVQTLGLRGGMKSLAARAMEGNAGAQRELARRYFEEEGTRYDREGVTQNYELAAQLWRLAADQGDADAQWELSVRYWEGEGVQQDKTESIRLLHLAANQGHDDAQFELGCSYWDGDGV